MYARSGLKLAGLCVAPRPALLNLATLPACAEELCRPGCSVPEHRRNRAHRRPLPDRCAPQPVSGLHARTCAASLGVAPAHSRASSSCAPLVPSFRPGQLWHQYVGGAPSLRYLSVAGAAGCRRDGHPQRVHPGRRDAVQAAILLQARCTHPPCAIDLHPLRASGTSAAPGRKQEKRVLSSAPPQSTSCRSSFVRQQRNGFLGRPTFT